MCAWRLGPAATTGRDDAASFGLPLAIRPVPGLSLGPTALLHLLFGCECFLELAYLTGGSTAVAVEYGRVCVKGVKHARNRYPLLRSGGRKPHQTDGDSLPCRPSCPWLPLTSASASGASASASSWGELVEWKKWVREWRIK